MAGIYDVMWRYRFLFSDVNALLARSAELLGEHNNFTRCQKCRRCWWNCSRSSIKRGILRADATAMNDLALNIWMITKYRFDFDGSLRGRAKLTEDSKVRGVQRTLSLLRPYLIKTKWANRPNARRIEPDFRLHDANEMS